MENKSEVQGNQNIVIQGVTDSTITVNVNGETQEINNKLDALKILLEKMQAQSFQTANKTYSIDGVSDSNFGFLIGQAGAEKKLPLELAENLITDGNLWVQSLRQELLKHGVSVGNRPLAIFQHYGWLIETFLQKMGTAQGRERTLRRLSFMAEAFQSSLRFMCYIQLTQILQKKDDAQSGLLSGFFQKSRENYEDFDLLNFLLITTSGLNIQDSFMPEIGEFVSELTNSQTELYGTALFLEKHRNKLIEGTIEEGESLDILLDEYLTALVFWLRKIAFLANYRLASIKDINLSYKFGSTKKFVHLYGELHGMYNDMYEDQDDFIAYTLEGKFTFNHSVLLFKGKDIATCLDKIEDTSSFLSLSPLIVDQSVYANKPTQTPEICYYIGQSDREFYYAQYKNELPYGENQIMKSNKFLVVKRQNNQQPKLNELFEQLAQVFKPFISPRL